MFVSRWYYDNWHKRHAEQYFIQHLKIDYIKPEEIPNIDLYMDQVTTFMEKNLSSTKRYEEDKILTKTMINFSMICFFT